MNLPEIQPSRNGNHKAPPNTSGAFPVTTNDRAGHRAAIDPGNRGGHDGLEVPSRVAQQRQRRTEFLVDPPARSLRSILYSLYRHEWAGGPLTRWIWSGLLLLGGLSTLWLQPWWLGLTVILATVLALFVMLVILRRSDFVRFEEQGLPGVTPKPLSPNNKIAVYATGHFTVEGQYRRFTYLPGYYRSFATREHAVLCLARDRRFLGLGQWPVLDVGMWYIFCTERLINQVRYGQLHFERESRPAVAIDYRLTRPAPSRRSGEQTLDETIYLVCTSEADTKRLIADLLTDRATVSPTADILETRQ